ncbi:daf-6 [Cordylochernes scorpioides]|uniref:Daf-6 n=1 Tax=Cordylochernes scorpioides TaxID=51811 RepID=A0ABY6K7B6_9ARAC|nr:daf-6 [Cordylochernes scorpioides]
MQTDILIGLTHLNPTFMASLPDSTSAWKFLVNWFYSAIKTGRDQMLALGHWLSYYMEGHVPQFILRSSNSILLVIIFMSIGIGFTGMRRLSDIHNDLEYLYTPAGSRSNRERKLIENIFNQTEFFTYKRITRQRNFVTLLLESEDGGNMLRSHIIKEIRRIDRKIHNITIKGHCAFYNLKDLCPLNKGICENPYALRVFDLLPTFSNGIPYPVIKMDNKLEYDDGLYIGGVFGGLRFNNEGNVRSVKAIKMRYHVTNRPDVVDFDIEPLLNEWKKAVHDININSHLVEISILSSMTFRLAMEQVLIYMPYLILYSFSMVAAFTTLNCLMSNPVLSKPYCGFLGSLLPLLGLLTTTGILLHLDVPFIDLNLTLPLLLLGR